MKRTLFTLALLGGFGYGAQAQTRLGIKAGAGLATFAGTNLAATQNLITPHGGLTLNAPVTSDGFFSIQPELLYSQKGAKYDDNFTRRMHYLDLPVLARINADGFIFEAGPQAGLLVQSNSTYETVSGTVKSSGTAGYRRVDVGYVAGVGYQLSSGPTIGLRYNGGLLGIQENGSKPKNSVFQLFLGYVFGARK